MKVRLTNSNNTNQSKNSVSFQRIQPPSAAIQKMINSASGIARKHVYTDEWVANATKISQAQSLQKEKDLLEFLVGEAKKLVEKNPDPCPYKIILLEPNAASEAVRSRYIYIMKKFDLPNAMEEHGQTFPIFSAAFKKLRAMGKLHR